MMKSYKIQFILFWSAVLLVLCSASFADSVVIPPPGKAKAGQHFYRERLGFDRSSEQYEVCIDSREQRYFHTVAVGCHNTDAYLSLKIYAISHLRADLDALFVVKKRSDGLLIIYKPKLEE